MQTRGQRTWMLVGLAAALVLGAAALGVLGGLVAVAIGAQRGLDATVAAPRPVATPEPPEPGSVAAVAARVLPSVVSIAVDAGVESGTGSGFVFRDDGYVVTNNHVIDAAVDNDQARVDVVFDDGRRVRADIVGRNVSYDIAVLRVDAADLATVDLGASANLRVGDSVIAIGAPLGLQGTVTVGIVSALDRPVSIGEAGAASFINAVQTDAAINPGNSGGPLLDGQGRVVGVTSAIATLARGDGGSGSIGLGFAVPVEAAARIASEIIESGVSTTPIVGVVLDTAFAGSGARVASLTPGGPAEAAGLAPGDVIVAVDGRSTPGVDEFVVAIRSNEPGDTVILSVLRNGVVAEVPVTLVGEQLD